MYYISPAISLVVNNGIHYLYNWDNADYIEFIDEEHPFLKVIQNKKEIFDGANLSDDEIDFLLSNGILYRDSTARLNDIKTKQNTIYNSSLNITLLPANQGCNFNCSYCYEDHSLKDRMGVEHIKRILKMIKNIVVTKKIKHVSISYFGGEPLLNKKFIFKFQEELLTLIEEYGISTSASMTTNGFLLDVDTARTLSLLGVNAYQITMDGTAEDHNKMRPLANGKSTYDTILKNLINFKNEDIQGIIDIRINFNEMSYTKKKTQILLDTFTTHFGSSNKFRFRLRPVGNYANANNRECIKKDVSTFENAEQTQFEYEELFLSNNLKLADFHMFSDIGTFSCYAAKDNSYIISPDYSIKKCTVALDSSDNNIGSLDINGDIIFNNNQQLWSEKQLETLHKKECTTCHMFTHCQGGACPLINIKHQKSICPPAKDLKQDWALRIVKELLKGDNS